MKAIGSREFNQDVGRAKRLARLEPLLVTDRGRPTHVLIGIEEWRRLSGTAESIVDLLAEEDATDLVPASSARAWSRP